jgi:hypothetical protein
MVRRRATTLGLGVHPNYAEAAARLPIKAQPASCASPPCKKVGGVVHLVPVGPIALDEIAHVIAGPKGEWQAPRSVVNVVKRLAMLKPEQLLDAQTIANIGDWPSKQLVMDRFPMYGPRLEAIGIKLITFGRDLFRIQVAEVAA